MGGGAGVELGGGGGEGADGLPVPLPVSTAPLVFRSVGIPLANNPPNAAPPGAATGGAEAVCCKEGAEAPIPGTGGAPIPGIGGLAIPPPMGAPPPDGLADNTGADLSLVWAFFSCFPF